MDPTFLNKGKKWKSDSCKKESGVFLVSSERARKDVEWRSNQRYIFPWLVYLLLFLGHPLNYVWDMVHHTWRPVKRVSLLVAAACARAMQRTCPIHYHTKQSDLEQSVLWVIGGHNRRIKVVLVNTRIIIIRSNSKAWTPGFTCTVLVDING